MSTATEMRVTCDAGRPVPAAEPASRLRRGVAGLGVVLASAAAVVGLGLLAEVSTAATVPPVPAAPMVPVVPVLPVVLPAGR